MPEPARAFTAVLSLDYCVRESVNEVVACLSQHGPTIKPMSFIGQAGAGGKKGLTQREQIEVILSFLFAQSSSVLLCRFSAKQLILNSVQTGNGGRFFNM